MYSWMPGRRGRIIGMVASWDFIFGMMGGRISWTVGCAITTIHCASRGI
jgi:hypothetical protein